MRNEKIRSAVFQAAIGLFAVLVVLWLAHNTATHLAARGITLGFDFLGRAARFPISQSVLPYSPTDRFAWAFVVGLANTLFASAVIIVSATLLGVVVAIARRSRHPLANGIATTFVETVRNTPLVVQLLFWYALFTEGLPHPRHALNPLTGVFLTDRGLYVPALRIDGDAHIFWAVLAAGIVATAAAMLHGRRGRQAMGARRQPGLIVAGIATAAAIGAWTLSGASLSVEQPQLGRFNFAGGLDVTPEFAAMFLGLVIYSTAFIGEIVRGGIDAVGVGQWEAGRALGLSDKQTLRNVVMPQALRVMIPPLTSQYINIVKNTTLALVVGYPDLAFVTSTTINQTGQAVEGILILMLVFLTISLAASWLMNWFNRRVMLVER
jgi:general L-amino acid transport system permease protein